jgi:hypothetical protein
MNDPLHGYLTTTASITTQWFFFACTINVAIAVLVNSNPVKTDKFKVTASLLATFLGFADCTLAFFYFPCIPLYYLFSYACAETRSYHLMVTLAIWSLIATVLAVQIVLIGYLWLRASFRHGEDVIAAIQVVKSDLSSALAMMREYRSNRRNKRDRI